MEGFIGGGPLRVVQHPHFWKAVILLAALVGGLWAWHYYKIRHDVRAENAARQELEARERPTPPINRGAILPSTKSK